MNKLFLQPFQKEAILNRLYAEETGNPMAIQQYKTALAVVERVKFQRSMEIVRNYLPEEKFSRFKKACIYIMGNEKSI